MLVNRPKSPVNLSYAIFAAVTVWWQGCWTILFNSSDPVFAAILVKIGYSGIIFLPVTFYHFNVEFLGLTEKRRFVGVSYLIGSIFLVSVWTTNQFVAGYYSYPWGYYPKAGLLHVVYLIFLNYLALQGIYLPYKHAKATKQPLRRNHIRYVLFANITYCMAAFDFLMNYGVNFYPMGFVGILISSCIISYAIYRYKLMDLNLAFRNSVVLILFALILSWPLVAVMLVIRSWWVAGFMIFFACLVGPKFFNTFRERLTRAVDRLPPFKGKYERFNDLHHLHDAINSARNAKEWGAFLLRAIQSLYAPKSAALMMKDDSMVCYLVKGSFGLDPGAAAFLSLPYDSPLVMHLEKDPSLLMHELVEKVFNERFAEAIKVELDFIRANICVPIYYQGELYAVLSLGNKSDNTMYNDLDITSITSIVRGAEHTLQVLLGGQAAEHNSAGWAHDLLHPFGPKGSAQFLDLIIGGKFGPLREETKQALDMVQKDIKFVARHIRRVITPTSAPETYNIEPHSPIGIFSRIREKYTVTAMQNKIQWVVRLPPPTVFALYDPDMIEYRVLTNLVENAFRHTPEGGSIELGYKVDGDAFVTYVRDTGEGIREEDQTKLFRRGAQVSSTTKGTAGLGLYNVAQVIEAHNGKVWVESQYGKGAAFFFALPLSKEKAA